MSFTVLPNAIISATFDGAIPGVAYVNRGTVPMATLHLTRHSAGIVAGTVRKPSDASAIRISASVSVRSDNPKADLASSNLRFYFVQFFSLADQRAFYAGPTTVDGNMFWDFARSPAFSGENEFMLDSESKSTDFPFYAMSRPTFTRSNSTLWMVTISMDDHPFNDLPLSFPNFASKRDNFLCTASKRFSVVTTVVLRDATDPTKPKRIMLGQISWSSEVACKIRWTKASDDTFDPKPPELTVRDFSCNDPVVGADADLAAKIDKLDLSTETFNDAIANAYQTVFGSTSITRNVQAAAKWHSSRVGDFFR